MKNRLNQDKNAVVNANGRPALPREKVKEKSIRPMVRTLIVFAIFVMIGGIYAFGLVGTVHDYKISVRNKEETYTEKTVTVQAVRGEIFDRNGEALVRNKYRYSLELEYGLMADTISAQNQDIAAVMDYLRQSKLIGSAGILYCPFAGTYPELSYRAEVLESSVAVGKLNRILKDLDLAEDASARDLAEALCKRYLLLDALGKPRFSAEEMTDILTVRYETEAIQFAPGQPLKLLENIGEDTIAAIRELNVSGTNIGISYEREYVYPGIASHILGRIGKIPAERLEEFTEKGYAANAIVGLDGCEYAFEDYLRGTDGKKVIRYDKDGHVISEEMVSEAIPGKDIYLTIDIRYQIAAETALEDVVAYVRSIAKPKKGDPDGADCDAAALVMEQVGTGDVLAIASYPTYDLSTFSKDYASLLSDARTPLFNRALEGTYAPGSTFKVGVAAAALTEQTPLFDKNGKQYAVFSPSTKINTHNTYTFYDDYQPHCWAYNYGYSHGSINVVTAIEVSCNCFFYELGRCMGINSINHYGKIYGLGQNTGIELHESTGVLADPVYVQNLNLKDAEGHTVSWTGGTTIQTAIGQGYNRFTPIQLAGYLATLVDGGKRYSAHLLSKVNEFGGKNVYTYTPTVLDSFAMSDSTYKTIISGMNKVVDENNHTVKAFDGFQVKVGGKTGTAEVNNQSCNGVYVGFAPLSAPEITVACVVERGSHGYNAAFAVRDVMDAYFADRLN